MESSISGFAAKVSRYFLDFLETDFKKQQAPRRRIHLKNDAGFRTGFPLRKYPSLLDVVWKLLSKPVGEIEALRIARNRFKAPISPTLRDLIRQHVDSLDALPFTTVTRETLDFARRKRGAAVENPETYVEEVQTAFVETVSKQVVAPILALLDGPFRQQAYSAIESVYDVETDLVDALTAPVVEQLPTALNNFVVSSEIGPTEKVLAEFFSESEAKQRVKAFFEDFATSDAYQELRDLTNYMRLGGESLQVYLYVCELRFGTAAFPVFYIPAAVSLDERNGDLVATLDPHLYVNKRAVDYIAQELSSSAIKLALSPIDNRIIYVDPERSFIDEMERVISKMTPTFDLSGELNIKTPANQTIASAKLRFSKAAYFAVFDKSDESLLNDYEALLNAIGENQQGVTELFQNIVRAFLLDDPRSIRDQIDDRWEALDIPARLVAESPIPLNEEQRKVLRALRDPECRFITVQGPPGTGKSHTIAAIAFQCILGGQNVLVLSDKNEALDVVEDKLESVLALVRKDDDFPNPILRLGKSGNTYTRLISQASQEKIRNHYRAAKANADKLDSETKATESQIRAAIAQTVNVYANVRLKDIEELQRLEGYIDRKVPGLTRRLQACRNLGHLDKLWGGLTEVRDAPTIEFLSKRFKSGSLPALLALARGHAVADKVADLRKVRSALNLFGAIGPRHQQALQRLIIEYDALRMPIVGYLFRGSKVRALNIRVGRELPCANSLDLHKRLSDLRLVHDALIVIKQVLGTDALDDEIGEIAYRIVATEDDECPAVHQLKGLLEVFWKAIDVGQGDFPELAAGSAALQTTAEFVDFIFRAISYLLLWHGVAQRLASAPAFDYVGSKTTLEQLYTTRMSQEIDRRFVEFVDHSRATAKALGGVIKAKQQFPQEAFEGLKQAFPCIIAGIREFAEYVPLKQEVFDVVVIDEASQVSVAQAFPALLRAKKVVVLGDQRQFSNVKSANASIALNHGYLTDLDQYFRAHISSAADKIQRLKRFDVKKSVLEFFDLIANYSDMLRKHFRGYQELISFSSKHFYGGQLQAIKVRGKPIEEVIEFSIVEPSEAPERYKNTNTPEADFIIDQLRSLAEREDAPSVGIITPFREQQQFLTRKIFSDLSADQFEKKLRLKIMTFDTCQGEERDVIMYSMVATPNHDVLNYVFPVSLENTEERIEEALKMQRLNVGFSRAKEKIHFVLSKPINKYGGSIGRVLTHYKAILEDQSLPEAEDTDPNSPMERKVLDWIAKTPFFQRNSEHIEVLAQFPVGDYIRQLDPTYQPPAYRCDFLLLYQDDTRKIDVIIEYDGFQEHFTEHQKIHVGNYDLYYRPQDIERQMVLESYGYKFLRINRFNLGTDPVATLSDRLYALVDATKRENNIGIVNKIHEEVADLNNGSSKHCHKCGLVKPKAEFFDPKLRDGAGGYGQICLDCKSKPRPPSGTGRRRRFRRYRRRW